MEDNISLHADSKDALNHLIDLKLREGYLLVGGMQDDGQGHLIQVMTQPRNIDNETTLAGVVRMIIMLGVIVTILYFVF